MNRPESSCELAIRVTPRSSRNRVEVEPDGAIRVWLTASPTDGQANKAACLLLAEKLGVPKSAVELLSGHKGRQKRVDVDGLSREEAFERLKKA
jgi:uncharacterized protein (TIGR00251 family)